MNDRFGAGIHPSPLLSRILDRAGFLDDAGSVQDGALSRLVRVLRFFEFHRVGAHEASELHSLPSQSVFVKILLCLERSLIQTSEGDGAPARSNDAGAYDRLLGRAYREAIKRGNSFVNVAHLLIALLEISPPAGRMCLARYGIDYEATLFEMKAYTGHGLLPQECIQSPTAPRLTIYDFPERLRTPSLLQIVEQEAEFSPAEYQRLPHVQVALAQPPRTIESARAALAATLLRMASEWDYAGS